MEDLEPSDLRQLPPQEAIAAGVRLTGDDYFASLSPEEQDAAVGKKAADALRAGEITLKDLVQTNRIKTEQDFITQGAVPE